MHTTDNSNNAMEYSMIHKEAMTFKADMTHKEAMTNEVVVMTKVNNWEKVEEGHKTCEATEENLTGKGFGEEKDEILEYTVNRITCLINDGNDVNYVLQCSGNEPMKDTIEAALSTPRYFITRY